MKRIMRAKNKVTLLLLSAILLLCIGFIFIACGVGPATKGINNDRGQYALDYTTCPTGRTCDLTLESTAEAYEGNSIEAQPITMEAWVMPKVTSSAVFFKHSEDNPARGAALKLTTIALDNSNVTPGFEIRRQVLTVGGGATSSVSYTVSGATIIDIDTWTHIAGILTNDDHSAVAGHPACADVAVIGADPYVPDGSALNAPWHLDLYINGVIDACDVTYGDATDPTFAAVAYANAPDQKAVIITFGGIIDESRVWRVDDRTILDCMSQELGTSGTCNRTNTDLLSYIRFNAGSGFNVMDDAGVFGGGVLAYAVGNDVFINWSTGWTTDTPF